jgi:predicted membrane channel-forming protein YqfA (hemolysin III family)
LAPACPAVYGGGGTIGDTTTEGVLMDDPAAFILLCAVCATAIVGVFCGLLWAAVRDGRDEAEFRARRGPRPSR